MCLMPYANNRSADQPAYPHNLISTFVVHCLDSTMPLVSISEISRLASRCSWADLFESYLVENPRRHIFAWCGSYILLPTRHPSMHSESPRSCFSVCISVIGEQMMIHVSLMLLFFNLELMECSSLCQGKWMLCVAAKCFTKAFYDSLTLTNLYYVGC